MTQTSNRRWTALLILGTYATAITASAANFSGSDDFSTISGSWGPDVTSGSGSFVVANGALNLHTPSFSPNEQAARFWKESYGSYTADWSLRMDVSLGTFAMSSSQFASAGMYVQNQSDVSQDFVRVILRRDGESLRSFYADAYANGTFLGSVWIPTLSTTVSLGLGYDAATHSIMAAYDSDGAANGYLFTPFTATAIDALGSDWHMTSSDVFGVRLLAQTTLPIEMGQLSIDNFFAGPTPLAVVPEPSTIYLGVAALGLFVIWRRIGKTRPV